MANKRLLQQELDKLKAFFPNALCSIDSGIPTPLLPDFIEYTMGILGQLNEFVVNLTVRETLITAVLDERFNITKIQNFRSDRRWASWIEPDSMLKGYRFDNFGKPSIFLSVPILGTRIGRA